MQIIETVALISINETIVVILISFLIFLFIINRIMVKPLQSVMNERELYIENMKADITDAQDSWKNLLNKIKQRESAAKEAGFKLRKEHEEAGTKEADKIFNLARENIVSLQEDTKTDVAMQLLQARKTLVAESEALATAIMEKVLDRRLLV